MSLEKGHCLLNVKPLLIPSSTVYFLASIGIIIVTDFKYMTTLSGSLVVCKFYKSHGAQNIDTYFRHDLPIHNPCAGVAGKHTMDCGVTNLPSSQQINNGQHRSRERSGNRSRDLMVVVCDPMQGDQM
ncbi:hypothetical protein EGR_04762 [Echinococcus granulosus]|uniref:Uncharacterized protein n=1 Tax=Echinococcus granulosus TaxID=6210 RepID=W6UFX8_ECHGR|nr:hypothetical protein EGR_04762 [Echinococcus granulosus]EUB60380.1 hypothetical protein EGR_04762 [Echinococcus granulosus]